MSLRNKTISGVKWTFVSTITLAVVGILKISILTRFLEASDFGLVAIVSVILGFTGLFMDMGLSSAILYRQDISKNEYASLYWFNIVFSIILFGLIYLSSPFIASFYEESELISLIPLMALNIILSGVGRQFKTIEQKDLNFKLISVIDIISAVLGLLSAIVLAILDYGVYSLVLGGLVQNTVLNGVFFILGMTKRGLILHFNYEETKPFLKIGVYQVGGQVVNYFNRDLDILLIGKFFGSEILGGYSLAKQLVRHPRKIVVPIVNKIGVSVLPKFQDDNTRLRKYFTKLFNGLGSLNALIYGGIAIFANYLVLMLYGQDFIWIVNLVQLFTVLTYLRTMSGTLGLIVITKGRTDYEFYYNLLTTIVMPLAIIVGVFYSVELIIILMGIIQLILIIPVWSFFFKKLINLKFLPYFKAHVFPMLIAMSVFLVYYFGNGGSLLWSLFALFLLTIAQVSYGYFTINEVGDYFKKYLNKYLN